MPEVGVGGQHDSKGETRPKGCESMSVNSPVAGLREEALARAVAPAGATSMPRRPSSRRPSFPGAHRDPRCTFWRTVAQELMYFGTAGHVRPWRTGR